MRLIDADELGKKVDGFCEIGMPCYFKGQDVCKTCIVTKFRNAIDNAPTVEYTFEEAFQKTVCDNKLYCPSRPQGEWVRKEDLIHYIATQYIEHNELVPIWLSIGDMKGGTE